MLFSSGYSQNLFDAENSKSYARFLQQSRQFSLAAIEYERILFMEPNNMNIRYDLIFAYRKADEAQKGIERLKTWYPKLDPDSTLAEEWIKLLLLNHSFSESSQFLLNHPSLPSPAAQYYLLATYMLESNWPAMDMLESNLVLDPSQKENFLLELNKHRRDLRTKSPGLALGLSALIPGLGKAYTKDWKDGIISLLFVATNAWQAYRGFSKDGISSTYGWIFGTMAVGFYGSNLYGSWQSAKNYNLDLNEHLHHEIEEAVFNNF